MNIRPDGTFRVMRHRNYRLYWFGFIVSNSGHWIQQVAQAWLVYEITNNALWLGAIGLVRALPIILLAPVGGAVADRLSKRAILYTTQSVQMLSAFSLGLLTYLGVVEVWHVLALAVVGACAMAFDTPTRHSMVPGMVGKEDLHAAISLNAIAFNGAALFGPSLAGVLVPLVGLAGAFFVNAASYGAVFVALTLMEFPVMAPSHRQSMGADLLDGFRYIRRSPIIMGLIGMAAINSFMARPYQQFLTVFARDVLHGDIGLAGLLMSASSLGTVLFMLTIAGMGRIQHKGKLTVGAGIGFSLILIAFAWSTNPILSLALLVMIGGLNMTFQTTVNTLLQENAEDEMRGRVMAAFTITAQAMQPLGQGPMGLTMEQFGPGWSLTLGAVVSLLVILYVAFVRIKTIIRLP